jgi:hypothetical protein
MIRVCVCVCVCVSFCQSLVIRYKLGCTIIYTVGLKFTTFMDLLILVLCSCVIIILLIRICEVKLLGSISVNLRVYDPESTCGGHRLEIHGTLTNLILRKVQKYFSDCLL